MRNVVVRRSSASRRNRHRRRNRDYDQYCRVYNLTGLPRSLLRSASRRGWMPGKPIKSRPSSGRAPTGSGCRSRGPPPEASSDVARGRVLLPAGLSAPLRGSWKSLLPARCQPARSSRAFVGMPRKSPQLVRSRRRRDVETPGSAWSSPSRAAGTTCILAAGKPGILDDRHDARGAAPGPTRSPKRGAHQSLRSRRMSGHWDQRGAKFAFGGCRNPQRPDTVMVGCRGGELQLEAVLPAAAGSSRRDRINAI